MKKLIHKYNIINKVLLLPSFLISLVTILLLSGGCKGDDFNVGNEYETEEGQIRIRAMIQPSSDTRADHYFGLGEVNPINIGTFYLAYPKNENNLSVTSASYETAIVEFGKEDPEVGFAYYIRESDGMKKDLKWKNVAQEGIKDVYLYLTNVNPDCYTMGSNKIYNRINYFFKKEENPYVASPLDKEMGTNDLISSGSITSTGGRNGYVLANASTSDIIFELYHRMALIDLKIEVSSSPDDPEKRVIPLENAKVEITNLYTTLSNFSPYYSSEGNYVPNGSSDYNCLISNMVKDNAATNNRILMIDPENKDKFSWEKITDEENAEKKLYSSRYDEQWEVWRNTYKVPEWVFPPQAFLESSWPKIYITLPKRDVTGMPNDVGEVVYKGNLPQMMYNTDPKLSQNPMVSRLTSGYILHVTATINSPNTELTFSPITIENWGDKGTFPMSSQKSGIYNRNDINKLISLYNNKELEAFEKAFQLERYGFVTDGLYIFQIWGNFSVEYNDIFNQIVPDPEYPFMFIFSDYKLTVKKGASYDGDDGNISSDEEILSGISGEKRFYEILTGNEPEILFQGIKSDEELLDFLNLCHRSDEYTKPSTKKLMKYGFLNSFNNHWDFYLEADVEVDLDNIYQIIDPYFLGNTYTMHLNGHTIKVIIQDKFLRISDNEFENYFSQFADKRDTYGITCAEDMYLMAEIYNNHYMAKPEMMGLFSITKSIGDDPSKYSWELKFRKAITFNIDRMNGSMRSDSSEGRPYYSIPFQNVGSVSLTLTNDYLKLTTTSNWSHLPKFLGGSANVNSKEKLEDLISYYNNPTNSNYLNLFQFGMFSNGKWIFNIKYTQNNTSYYSEYDDLFGSMVPDEENGKFDYEVDLGTYNFVIKNMPDGKDATTVSNHYFYQEGDDRYAYPNTAADLCKIMKGTYWEEYPE